MASLLKTHGYPKYPLAHNTRKTETTTALFRYPTVRPPLPGVGVPMLLGAKDDSGTDVYLSATKLWLGTPSGYNLLTNLTARYTKANVFGLLGFGSENNDSAKLEWEGSLAVLISPTTAIGTEFRTQTNRLGGLAEEDTVVDAFIAYFPNKSISITAAYVDLGNLPCRKVLQILSNGKQHFLIGERNDQTLLPVNDPVIGCVKRMQTWKAYWRALLRHAHSS